MNWFTFIFLLSIRSGNEFAEIKKEYFLQSNFWCTEKQQVKTDKGFPYIMMLDFEDKDYFNKNMEIYYEYSFYPLKSGNCGYLVVEDNLKKEILNFLKLTDVDKTFLKIYYTFTDVFSNFLENDDVYKLKIKEYVTYRLLEKTPENNINFKEDVSDVHIRKMHIKDLFRTNVYIMLLKFDEYIELFEKSFKEEVIKSLEEDKTFNLCFFESFSECLRNLENFNKKLRHFSLVDDSEPQTNCEMISFDEQTCLKFSQFENRICEDIDKEIKKIELEISKRDMRWFVFEYSNGETNRPFEYYDEYEFLQNKKIIFSKCCDYFKYKMMKNKIFLPIGGEYDIDYYLKKLCQFITTTISIGEEKYELKRIGYIKDILGGLVDNFYSLVEKMQSTILNDLCETEFILKHFFEVIEKKLITLDDKYKNVEKIMCDYHNMLVYFFSFDKSDLDPLFSYASLVCIGKYDLKITEGIVINFYNSFSFENIKAFNKKGEEIFIEKDIDFFINNSRYLYFVSEDAFRKKNIAEIEIISKYDDKKAKFKIEDY